MLGISRSVIALWSGFWLMAILLSTVSAADFHGYEDSGDASNRILRRDYEGFTVWLDCARRGAIKFRYNAQRDEGNEKRLSSFSLDPDVPADCQQRSSATYKAQGQRYDRGHLVPANHLDHSKLAIKQSNYMVNILPQAANMNRGAWYQTEKIVECYRDKMELLVIGGVIYGNNTQDDLFKASHGVETPDAFWKVIISNEKPIAWIIPNSQDAKAGSLDRYLVSVSEIEKRTGEKMPIADQDKNLRPAASWPLPKGCNLG